MKARKLQLEVSEKNNIEKEYQVKKILKEKEREIEKTRVILNKMENQYEKLLDMEIDDIYYDRCW